MAPWASKWSLASLNSSPVEALIRARDFWAKSGWVLIPVPVAVPPPPADPGVSMSVKSLGLVASDGEYLPIVKIAPVYPARAKSRGIEGWCIVEYTVTTAGTTRDVKVVEDRAEELGRGQGGVEHHRGVRLRGQVGQEVACERRLARAHLAGDEDEAAPLAVAELEMGEGLGVPLGEIEVLGIRGQVEGLLGEAVPLADRIEGQRERVDATNEVESELLLQRLLDVLSFEGFLGLPVPAVRSASTICCCQYRCLPASLCFSYNCTS